MLSETQLRFLQMGGRIQLTIAPDGRIKYHLKFIEDLLYPNVRPAEGFSIQMATPEGLSSAIDQSIEEILRSMEGESDAN